MTGSVTGLKGLTNIERPDGSANNSFPSGHTAKVFSGAEYLWHEYKGVNIWYGISYYALAAGTVFFRIYNGRLWLSDVAMGTGIGIMSTKIAYWTFPYIQKHFFKSRKEVGDIIIPFYNGKQLCLGILYNLNRIALKAPERNSES